MTKSQLSSTLAALGVVLGHTNEVNRATIVKVFECDAVMQYLKCMESWSWLAEKDYEDQEEESGARTRMSFLPLLKNMFEDNTESIIFVSPEMNEPDAEHFNLEDSIHIANCLSTKGYHVKVWKNKKIGHSFTLSRDKFVHQGYDLNLEEDEFDFQRTNYKTCYIINACQQDFKDSLKRASINLENVTTFKKIKMG